MTAEAPPSSPFRATNLSQGERQEAWEAMDLIHEAIGEVVPPGALPSQEEINRRYGSTFLDYAQALVEAISRIRSGPAAQPEENHGRD